MAADPLTSATVDDLLNFDRSDDEDPRLNSRDDKTTLSPRATSKRKAADLDDTLGLDSEVKVKKQRKPIAKLDEARLLSAPGIPKLRADARIPNFLNKKLRIKGKGHEFTDMARLLSYYQLWLDNLYPRAKFADGLQLIEKVGHSRRMQVMRKEWIDERKPGYLRAREAKKKAEQEERRGEGDMDDVFNNNYALMSGANNEPLQAGSRLVGDSLFVADTRDTGNTSQEDDSLPDDDELEALLAEQHKQIAAGPLSTRKKGVDDDSEGEDDLDALLAEQGSRRAGLALPVPAPLTEPQNSTINDDDAGMDDLDALLAEQELRSKATLLPQEPGDQTKSTQNKVSVTSEEDEFPIDEDDDLEALLAEQDKHQGPVDPRQLASLASGKTSNAALVAADEKPEEPDGADMFSSSPVGGTAQSTFDTGGEQPPESLRTTVHTTAISRQPTTSQGETLDNSVTQAVDARTVQGDEARTNQNNQEEESQGRDADDMFSSSPVQHE